MLAFLQMARPPASLSSNLARKQRFRFLGCMLVVAFLSFSGAQASAATLFSDRTSFETQFPGLPMEDFSTDFSFADPNQTITGFTGPLNSTTNSVVYTPGEILPGVNISDGAAESLGYAVTNGFGIVATDEFLFSNQNLAGIVMLIDFQPGVNAVGVDIFAAQGSIGLDDNVTIDVFDTLGGLLASTMVVSTDAGQFFGVFSSVEIGQISLEAVRQVGGNTIEVIDNLSFGAASLPEPAVGLLLAPALVALLLAPLRGGRST